MTMITKNAGRLAVHLVVAVAVTYALTGSWALGGLVAVIEPVCNVAAMHFYDQIWDKAAAARASAPRCKADAALQYA